jgi:TorA maturation chaperone TorD
MVRCTAEERALARAALYRLLALAFSYPTPEVREALPWAIEVARVAAELADAETRRRVEALASALAGDGAGLEAAFQRVFTLSYSEDCPPYETAFSSSHIFQQTQEQADLAGFYRAFGVNAHAERPDHIALELEFCYLLVLKEAHARELGEPDHIRICRDAQRVFLRDHLARWAPLIGQRVAVTGAASPYGAAGALLVAFVAWEERYLRLGRVVRFRNEPVLIADEPGEMSCPAAELATAEVANLPFFESREEAERVLVAPS